MGTAGARVIKDDGTWGLTDSGHTIFDEAGGSCCCDQHPGCRTPCRPDLFPVMLCDADPTGDIVNVGPADYTRPQIYCNWRTFNTGFTGDWTGSDGRFELDSPGGFQALSSIEKHFHWNPRVFERGGLYAEATLTCPLVTTTFSQAQCVCDFNIGGGLVAIVPILGGTGLCEFNGTNTEAVANDLYTGNVRPYRYVLMEGFDGGGFQWHEVPDDTIHVRIEAIPYDFRAEGGGNVPYPIPGATTFPGWPSCSNWLPMNIKKYINGDLVVDRLDTWGWQFYGIACLGKIAFDGRWQSGEGVITPPTKIEYVSIGYIPVIPYE